jgi:aubergine-like protein
VASIDPTFTSYGSFVSFHENREEMSDYMSVGIGKILGDHGLRNGVKWIKRLILFRDGVGEGQVGFVVRHEIAALIDKIKKFDPDIKVAVVIVSKRIHSQFYLKTGTYFFLNFFLDMFDAAEYFRNIARQSQ